MIRIEGLRKTFGKLKVLRDVTMTIQPSSITAILGPNASGKSTLIKSVLGLVNVDAGEILVDGQPIAGRWSYRSQIGYMPQIARFPENLRVSELLRMIMDIRGAAAPADEDLIEAFNLGEVMNRQLRVLSGGTRQRINAVMAFMFDPKILILDEPTAGLDPVSITVLKDKIRSERARGKTIILTTHNMHEVEELADHILFLLDGRSCFDGSVVNLKKHTAAPDVERAIVSLMEEVS